MNEANELFAARLKQLLDEADEKQVDLARLLHVTEATVSRYLKGRIPDDIQTLITLANHFDVTVDFLIGRTETRSGAGAVRGMGDEQLIEQLTDMRDRLNGLLETLSRKRW